MAKKSSVVRWTAVAVVVAAVVVVEGSVIRRQRKAAAAALAEERTEPPDPVIHSAPEIQVSAPPVAAPTPPGPSTGAGTAAGPGEGRYADLLRTLAPTLPAAQLAKLRDLLDAREHAASDALDAAREAGIDPALAAAQIQHAVAQERASIDERIKTDVGQPALAAVQRFDAAHPEADPAPPPSPPPGGPN